MKQTLCDICGGVVEDASMSLDFNTINPMFKEGSTGLRLDKDYGGFAIKLELIWEEGSDFVLDTCFSCNKKILLEKMP